MEFGRHRQGKGSITASASGTVTIWAASFEGRLNITRGFVSVITPAAGALVDILETTGDGASAATLWTVSGATEGVAFFDFGDKGYHGSHTGTTRLVLGLSAANATVHAVFAGYSGLGS